MKVMELTQALFLNEDDADVEIKDGFLFIHNEEEVVTIDVNADKRKFAI